MDGREQLTERQWQVVSLAAHGFTAEESADLLDTSMNAVNKQRASARAKLDARSLTHLVYLLCGTEDSPLGRTSVAGLLADAEKKRCG